MMSTNWAAPITIKVMSLITHNADHTQFVDGWFGHEIPRRRRRSIVIATLALKSLIIIEFSHFFFSRLMRIAGKSSPREVRTLRLLCTCLWHTFLLSFTIFSASYDSFVRFINGFRVQKQSQKCLLNFDAFRRSIGLWTTFFLLSFLLRRCLVETCEKSLKLSHQWTLGS